jgi:hypothetical protein
MDLSIVTSVYQRVNLHFPMVFLWFSYGFPMVSSWQLPKDPGRVYPNSNSFGPEKSTPPEVNSTPLGMSYSSVGVTKQ